MRFSHQPALLKEVNEYLDLKPGQTVIDCTVGGGGHAKSILKEISPGGFLLGIDLSEDSLERAEESLKEFKGSYKLVKDNFKNITKIKDEQRDLGAISSILSDLGLAFYQFKEKGQGGFSFSQRERLDMRLDKSSSLTAEYIINTWSEEEIYEILRNYGEEIHARGIARKIVRKRKEQPIVDTQELAELVGGFYKNSRRPRRIHPATKTFQALRIAVNDELNNLKEFLKESLEILGKNGKIAVISYHSGEDKIVKDFFRAEARGCICPPEIPICKCGHKPKIKIITKKPIVPQEEEIKSNPAARSAKLRVAQVI